MLSHYADWRQTQVIAKNPDRYNEENPFLGHEPALTSVNQFFSFVAITHLAISYMLPRPARTIWQAVTIVNSGNAVYQNHKRLGLAIQLHF